MYRYETHLHTKLVSACSTFTPDEVVEKYTRLGYDGIFVTDHFLNGNTTVPNILSWRDKIKLFFNGYRAVKERAGERLKVFPALEYSYKGTDFLVYGMSEEWLLDHPEMIAWSAREFCHKARGMGALVFQAHPYREACYIDHIRLFPSDVDGIETLNIARDERCNRLGDNLANEYGLLKLAGSDIHGNGWEKLAGMQFSTPIVSVADFIQKMKAGEGETFTLTDRG